MSNLKLTELDFAANKNALKEFLKSQDFFQDYNFEGSALSILLDILAYNTQNMAFYGNMVANEMFLDTAQIRANLVSRAKAIGYLPSSRRSARAVLSMEFFPNDNPATITIPLGTQFTTVIDGTTYTFQTTKAYVVTKNSDSEYVASNVEIVEGTKLIHRFTVDLSDEAQRFVLPNAGVDLSTVMVKVQQSANNNTTEFFKVWDSINELTPESAVYFVQEAEDGKHEIYFGDGVVGKALSNGNIVIVEYIVSNGSVANTASTFELTGNIGGYTGTTITTTTPAYSGREEESLDSIRFLAPLAYQGQNRAVTKTDYEYVIKKDYPQIDSVRVWGGEENDPPQYGRVFVSLKPAEGLTLSESEKQYLVKNIIRKKNVISIEVVVVDPVYTFLVVASTVKFRSANTPLTADGVRAVVQSAITTFADDNLNKFDSYFKYSRFVDAIDNANESILNNLTTVRLKQQITPILGVPTQYELKFNNALDRGDRTNSIASLSSNAFTFNGFTCYLEDNGSGTVYIYRIVDGAKVVVKQSVGTIDYVNGKVILSAFAPTAIAVGETINVIVTPLHSDVVPLRNQILIVDPSDVTITMSDQSA